MARKKTHSLPENALNKRNVGLFVLILTIILIALLINFFNSIRTNEIKKNLDSLYNTLSEFELFEGIERNGGCGRTQVKFGPGAKLCAETIEFYGDNIKENDAGQMTKILFSSIAQLDGAVVEKGSDEDPAGKQGPFKENYVYFSLANGAQCSSSSSFSSNQQDLRLSVYCDTTSWFTRTFETGQFLL